MTDPAGQAAPPVLVQGQPVDDYPPLAPEAARGRLREITEIGNPVLHHACRPVTEFGTAELATLIDDMFLTMYVADGVGLAANQVGVDLRLFVYDCPDDEGVRHVGHLVNPVVEPLPPGERTLTEGGEGCLSVPGATMTLARPEVATVRGFDRDGNPVTVQGTGFFARCLLHETDHLEGQLYVDRLSRRDRNEAVAQMDRERAEVYRLRAERAAALASGGGAD